jgi:nitroreductase
MWDKEDGRIGSRDRDQESKTGFEREKHSQPGLETHHEGCHLGPSCFNNQPWRFVVVNERRKLEALHDSLAGGNDWMKKAPAIIVLATKPDLDARLSDRREYALLGCGLAAENLMLQAFKKGVVGHAIAGFDPLVVKARLGIPGDYIVITLIALGSPGDETHLSEKHLALEHSPRHRKPGSEVICWNGWSFQEPK